MEEHRDKLVENIEYLEEINQELIIERDALLYDETEIELRAQSLGFFSEDAVQIKLPAKQQRSRSRTLGTLIGQVEPPKQSRIGFRVVYLCVFSAVFAATFVWRRNGRDNRRK
jgi:hypothetical protein